MTPQELGLTDEDFVTVEAYGGGGFQVHWPLDGPQLNEWDYFDDGADPSRRDLTRLNRSNEQSKKSRLRAAWTLSNALCEWEFMTTLTYPKTNIPETYEETAKHRNAFLRRAKKVWPNLAVGWILEFTKKKAAHYHVFWGLEAAQAMRAMPTQTLTGRKFCGTVRDRVVVRGEVDERIQLWWRNQAGDGSEAFAKFQAGGITEKILDPKGAGKYVAKEAGKRDQKIAPFLVGQWYDVSRNVRPKVKRVFKMTVGDYRSIFGNEVYKNIF